MPAKSHAGVQRTKSEKATCEVGAIIRLAGFDIESHPLPIGGKYMIE
jgi:hypothetical protein